MNKNKIIVDFMRVDNVLIAKIINTPECLIGTTTIIGGTSYELKSCYHPEVCRYSLYLDGSERKAVRTVAYAYDNVEIAKEAMKNFASLIDEYNSKVKVTSKAKSEWDIEEYMGDRDEM